MEPSTSDRFKLNWTDVKKAFRTFLIALAGFVLTYILNVVTNYDFGMWNTFIYPGVTGLVELGRRWLTDHSNT